MSFVKGKRNPQILISWPTAGASDVCNHEIAVLYEVNYAYKNGYISPAPTSMPQGWNIDTRKRGRALYDSDLTFRNNKKAGKKLLEVYFKKMSRKGNLTQETQLT